ncbi:hypothetical protein D0838_04950 [Bordetella avium]|uniref:hypothetical protein n=1 Tax=Bordetella avium TaxID=521 RepID=UPI000E69EB4F|nr:hypothetical protein [Bordetella avium]RIQ74550.1 hypothetical protein D0838_04950 [Bordetella avium]
MSAFCVFGMTENLARKAAETAWRKHLSSMTQEARAHVTDADESAWLAVKTAYVLQKARPVQLSAPFSTPQFAEDFMGLAANVGRTSQMRIMVRGELHDKNGALRISKRTKRPIIGWVPY